MRFGRDCVNPSLTLRVMMNRSVFVRFSKHCDETRNFKTR